MQEKNEIADNIFIVDAFYKEMQFRHIDISMKPAISGLIGILLGFMENHGFNKEWFEEVIKSCKLTVVSLDQKKQFGDKEYVLSSTLENFLQPNIMEVATEEEKLITLWSLRDNPDFFSMLVSFLIKKIQEETSRNDMDKAADYSLLLSISMGEKEKSQGEYVSFIEDHPLVSRFVQNFWKERENPEIRKNLMAGLHAARKDMKENGNQLHAIEEIEFLLQWLAMETMNEDIAQKIFGNMQR